MLHNVWNNKKWRLDLSNNHKGAFTLNFFANHFFNYTPVISHFSLWFSIFFYSIFLYKRAPKYQFKNRTSKEFFNKVEVNNVKWRVWEVTRRLLKRTSVALCVVAACSQFIKHHRKHSRVSNTIKRKCWVKP